MDTVPYYMGNVEDHSICIINGLLNQTYVEKSFQYINLLLLIITAILS